MKKYKVILDCDPGHDDAIAIFLAAKYKQFEVLGISTSAGNQSIEKTSRNAYNVSRYFDLNVPIAIGHATPLKRKPYYCPEIHGESGLDGFDFPKYDYKYYEKEGYELIIDLCKKNKEVILIPTGPLTNIALALSKDPLIKENIKEIVLMGGSTKEGNITKFAEFNILVDPEAADIVFKSGIPIKMLGLNVTRQILVFDKIVEKAERLHTKSSDFFVKLMKVFNQNQRDFFHLEAGPLHDPCTVISLISKRVFRFEKMQVDIETEDIEKSGMTRCKIDNNGNAFVATKVNLRKYWKIIFKALKKRD